MAEVAPNILLWVEGDDKRRTVTLRMAKKSYTARTRRELAELIGLIDSLSQAMKEHLSSYYGESSYDGPSEAKRSEGALHEMNFWEFAGFAVGLFLAGLGTMALMLAR